MKQHRFEAKRPVPLPARGNPATDPHLPHTTRFERRPTTELNLPPAAKALMDERWPELERTITQYDKATGMLEMYRLTRDVTAAAGWPENMAYQVRDLILQKLADSKIQANFRSGGTFFKEPDQSAYESMGREIVDALLRDEKTEPIPFKDVAFKPRVHLEPKTKPVGRDPYVRPDDLAHCKSCGSRHHSTAHCPHRGQPVV